MAYIYNKDKGYIAAVVPESSGYSATWIYYMSGECEKVDSRVITIMEKYVANWGLNLSMITANSSRAVTPGTTPFAVTYNHTFVPLRIREKDLRSDTAYGYFCHELISYPEFLNTRDFVELTCNNRNYKTLTSKGTLKHKQLLAISAQEEWQEKNGFCSREAIMQRCVYNWFISGRQVFEHIMCYTNANKEDKDTNF